MPPPEDGNTRLPFADLIQLEKIDERTYRSIALPFNPGGPVGPGRSYGGHVYMQAAWAACQTVGEGFLLHNISGNFILAGLINVPFVYKVHNVRDGRSYKTRIVNVTQARGKGICFTCTCSFKTPENSYIDAQPSLDLWDEYAVVLRGKKPADFDECPSMDVPFYIKRRQETGLNDEFPGLESHKVDMSAYNNTRETLDRREMIFYRPIGDLPADQPNMHLCAHLYSSDRNSLFHVANIFGVGDIFTQMVSLVHTAVFHSPIEDLLFRPSTTSETSPMDDGKGRWFVKEDFSTRLAAGRGLLHGRVWNAGGVLVSSLMQDGMIRYTKKPDATAEELEMLARRQARLKVMGKL